MTRWRHIARLAAGFLAQVSVTALLAASVSSPSALAQSDRPVQGRSSPRPFVTSVHPSPAGSAPVLRATEFEGQPQTGLRPAIADSAADATSSPDEQDAVPPVGGRRPPVDGDLNWPPQPAPVVDGVVEAASPEQAVDGIDPTVVDTRTPEELGPFELPARDGTTPEDPFQASIEIEPILDRRPAKLARFEPFEPVGLRRGGFTIFPEAEISVAALDNLYRSSSAARGDVFLDVKPQVRAVSNWRRHALEFRASGLSTFHNHFPSEDDRGGAFEARGRIDVSRRTNVEAFAGYELAQETRGSINAANAAGDRADVQTRRAGVTLNHRFNRLSLQLRGTVTDQDYSGTTGDTGAFVSNDERDARTREFAVRAQWEFKPTFAVFGETAYNWRDYNAAPTDGISRESQGERVRVGVGFGNSSKRLRGEISIGQGHQQFQDSSLPEIRGIIVDANLAWRVSGLTSVLLTARTDVGESTLAGSGGALSRTAGLEVRHAFQRQLIGTAALQQTLQDYEGSTVSERELAAIVGLEYHLNRELTLFSRYQHIAFDSSEVGRDYSLDEIRVGMRVRR